MSQPEAKIRLALYAAVYDLDLPGWDPDTELSYPGKHFDPPNDQTYLSVQFSPNIKERTMLDSDGPAQFLGLLLVNVFWTANAGERFPMERAALVADQFPTDRKIIADEYKVRVTRRPDIGGLIELPTKIQVPVTIWWESYV